MRYESCIIGDKYVRSVSLILVPNQFKSATMAANLKCIWTLSGVMDAKAPEQNRNRLIKFDDQTLNTFNYVIIPETQFLMTRLSEYA